MEKNYRIDLKDYVTEKTAWLLEKAGYPQGIHEIVIRRLVKRDGKVGWTDSEPIVIPTLWKAMKWLREEKRISVEVVSRNKDNWRAIVDNHSAYYYGPIKRLDNRPTYEQACDAGIAAACEWLLDKTNKQ